LGILEDYDFCDRVKWVAVEGGGLGFLENRGFWISFWVLIYLVGFRNFGGG
jgi:hypothetical protein